MASLRWSSLRNEAVRVRPGCRGRNIQKVDHLIPIGNVHELNSRVLVQKDLHRPALALRAGEEGVEHGRDGVELRAREPEARPVGLEEPRVPSRRRGAP